MSLRENQKEKRYQQILAIALDEFITKGYYGTSTREIAKIAGISSGLMFHYFDSKLALYEALIEIGCNEMGNWTPEEDCDSFTILKAAIEQIFMAIEHNPYFCKMFIFMDQANRSNEISEKVNQRLSEQNIVSQTIPLIKKAQEAGQVREGDVQALSMAFWCAVQGIAQGKADAPENVMPQADWVLDIIRK
ncbi:MAG TPA: TetR/AcrR family transcriptional regulator [Lachnospiraceae bacterium]|nr:TetR/AcrR family transcriptional regulator [Lachnospiraceae bacterium]